MKRSRDGAIGSSPAVTRLAAGAPGPKVLAIGSDVDDAGPCRQGVNVPEGGYFRASTGSPFCS